MDDYEVDRLVQENSALERDKDDLELIRYALDNALEPQRDAIQKSQKYSDCIIVAGIP